MSEIDKRDRLKEEPFNYKITKSNKTIIYYEGRQIMILNGNDTIKFQSKIKNKSPFEVQLILAKTTGNFKRGNERSPSI